MVSRARREGLRVSLSHTRREGLSLVHWVCRLSISRIKILRRVCSGIWVFRRRCTSI